MEESENEKLARSISEGTSVADELRRKEGEYKSNVDDRATPKGSSLGAQPSPFRSVKG